MQKGAWCSKTPRRLGFIIFILAFTSEREEGTRDADRNLGMENGIDWLINLLIDYDY